MSTELPELCEPTACCLFSCKSKNNLKRSKPAIRNSIVRQYLHDLYTELYQDETKGFYRAPFLEAIEILIYGYIPRKHGKVDR